MCRTVAEKKVWRVENRKRGYGFRSGEELLRSDNPRARTGKRLDGGDKTGDPHPSLRCLTGGTEDY
jgi:hypothetical protein